jgi:hypothetical protein
VISLFGFCLKKSKKQRNQERTERSRAIGRYGEEMFKINHPFDKVERAPRGQDFKVRPYKGIDMKTLRPKYGRTEYHEVKTRGTNAQDLLKGRNTSHQKLSPLQRKTQRRMKKKGTKYAVDEYNAPY